MTPTERLDILKATIQEKDYISAKSCVVSEIRIDPRFEKGVTNSMLQILDEQAPDIFEEEATLSYETKTSDSTQWNERYFAQTLMWFERNFAKSRLVHIKEVGQKVYPAKTATPKVAPAQEQPKRPTQAPKSKKLRPQSIAIAAGAVVAVVAAVLLLIKLLK